MAGPGEKLNGSDMTGSGWMPEGAIPLFDHECVGDWSLVAGRPVRRYYRNGIFVNPRRAHQEGGP